MSFKRFAAVALFLASQTARCQQIPDRPDREAGNPAVEESRRLRLDAGRTALSEKRHAEAVGHFANALWWDPFAPSILSLLVEAAAPNDDARTLWAHQLAAATADERGGIEPKGVLKALLARDPFLGRIAHARADAVLQLAATSKEVRSKDAERAIVASWALGLTLDLVSCAPALRRRHGPAISELARPELPDSRSVLSALKGVMDKALGERRPDLAIRAAHCLLGLAAQSRFKDLEGPKPPALEAVAMAARAGLARARDQIEARRKGALPTIAELDAMTKEEREKFTREHASFENPGVTISPNGLYRVETTCGHATLLGVAKTVELHHARLARHFGQDPFPATQGIVRVVPESAGLEAEGAPYWWAGGFQSGPVTTVKFSCGTIGGLGHGLTHELTHRFDGALNAGIPAWLAEGRAVWTGAAFGPAEDAAFVSNHASFGTVEDAYLKGYGDENNLEKLVEGTIEDYRHNYTAGYALYLFLATWVHEGQPLYAERLARFQRGCKEKGGNSLDWFTACFCDGKAGRPKDFKAFAGEFAAFVKGFYWQSPAPWTSRYTQQVPRGERDPFVYDAPTWHASRDRAEPWFGQDQARIAGDLLFEAGRRREAVTAYAWSLVVDEWRPAVTDRLARLLEEENRLAAAWALQSECARRFGTTPPASPPPPELSHAVAKLVALTDVLAAAHRAYSAEKPVSAAAMAADHDRIRSRLGSAAISGGAAPDAAGLHPLDEPPRMLGLFGWEEDKLTGYEERRVKDLWYEVPEGDLHVGRAKPREGTGTMDRAAHQLHAFVRTREWFAAGRYVVTARIQCTTSYTSGAVILGFTRRDRNVRVHFSGGDFLYSIGAKEDKTRFDAISANLHGLTERDGPLWGANPGRRIPFAPPTNTFALRILVDGPEVRAFVNDELVGTYQTPEGHPVEGYVGFASGQGAYLVANPTVQRRDRSKAAGADAGWPRGLDLARAGTETRAEILNGAARGLPVTASGAIVLWIPELGSPGKPGVPADYLAIISGAAMGLDAGLDEAGLESTFLVCLPASLGQDAIGGIESDLKLGATRATAVLTHRHAAPLTTRQDAEGAPPEPTPTVLFLDRRGVIRVADRFDRGQHWISPVLQQWLSVFEALATAQGSPTERK